MLSPVTFRLVRTRMQAKASLPLGALLLALAPLPGRAAGPLRVSADRDGAKVIVDGEDTGLTTPAVVPDLAPGWHEVTVVAGCERADTRVEVGEAVDVVLDLEPMPGRLVIETEPAQANVTIDNEPATGAIGDPIEVSCGTHSVGASYPGYQSAFVNVEVGPGQDLVLPLRLDALGKARLVVTVDPPDAAVVLDDHKLSVGNFDGSILATPHLLEVDRDGYRVHREQFVAEEGQEVRFDIALEREPAAAAPAEVAAQPLPTEPLQPPARRGSKAAKVAGAVLGAGGMASAAVSFMAYEATANVYENYQNMVDAANATNDPALADRANTYFDEQVVPVRRLTWTTGAAAAVMLTGGVVLFVAF